MKIKITTKRIVLSVIIVAVIGGLMLSRPITKVVKEARPCHDPNDWGGLVYIIPPETPLCDQDGNILPTWGMWGEKTRFFILKTRLSFIIKKYILGVGDKDLLNSITKIKVINMKEYGD